VGGYENAVEELLVRGAAILAADEKGHKLLQLAVESRSPQMVTLLLNRGAAMCAQDRRGRTTLHLAAERGTQKMIRLLEASVVDRLGRTTLYLSTQLGYGGSDQALGRRRGIGLRSQQ
jgi:ankyrin repeat protein